MLGRDSRPSVNWNGSGLSHVSGCLSKSVSTVGIILDMPWYACFVFEVHFHVFLVRAGRASSSVFLELSVERLSVWSVPAFKLAWRVAIVGSRMLKEAPHSSSLFPLDVQLRMRRKRFGIGCWRGTSPRIARISSLTAMICRCPGCHGCHGLPWDPGPDTSWIVLRWILDDFLVPRPHSWGDWRCVAGCPISLQWHLSSIRCMTYCTFGTTYYLWVRICHRYIPLHIITYHYNSLHILFISYIY